MQQTEGGRKPVPGRSRLSRVIQFPLVRFVVAVVVVNAAVNLARFLVPSFSVGDGTGRGVDFGLYSLYTLVMTLVTLFSYAAYVRVVERRAVTELSLSRAPKDLGLGILLGAGFMAATVAIIWLLGGYEFTWTYAWAGVFAALLSAILAGVGEEIIFRGILLRITEEGLGTWVALAISAAAFGAVHIFNPDATVVGAAAIAVEAGIFIGALYILIRRLWVCIGLHAAWNFIQGGIFGIPVSGTGASAGLLSAEPVGPVLLSGDEFGAEASLVAMVLGLTLGIYFLGRAVKQGRIVQPFWRRRSIVRNGETLSQPGA